MCFSQNFVFCTPELLEAVTRVKINEMGSGWSLSIRESPLYKMAVITPLCQSGTFYLGQTHMVTSDLVKFANCQTRSHFPLLILFLKTPSISSFRTALLTS